MYHFQMDSCSPRTMAVAVVVAVEVLLVRVMLVEEEGVVVDALHS